MNALICSTILVCSTLLSPGGSPIKLQLLEPTEPISLKPENKTPVDRRDRLSFNSPIRPWDNNLL
jgi:hypothetical protein